ncbi:MAG: hypothetical protein P8Y70_06985 [Candidatus Lokiarchaeota archaeon]
MTLIDILNNLEGKEVQIFLKNRDQYLEGILDEFNEEIITLKTQYTIDYVKSSEISFIRVKTS